MCLGHTWYLAVDMQLHIASPIVLFWILGQRSRVAWAAMTAAFAASIAGATTYNVINGFSQSTGNPNEYMIYYYIHTLNRISPFVIGMMIGYILHLYRGKTVRIPLVMVGLLWIMALTALSAVMIASHFNIQPDWDNQLADNIINSSIRPVWAASVGWLVFACKNGYGGPVSWLLSLHIFKILGRLSYSMYIVHYPIIYLINATALQPIYFAVNLTVYKFLIRFTLSVLGGFLLTILIDFPFSSLIKMFIGGGPRPPPKEEPCAPEKPETAISVVNNIRDDDPEKSRM